MSSLVSILWVLGNVIGIEIDAALKYGTLAWILFIYNSWKTYRMKEFYLSIKHSQLNMNEDIVIDNTGYIRKSLNYASAYKFEIIFTIGTILTQIDAEGWRFYDSALLYLLGFGNHKIQFHPLFFSIICMSFGISIYFILLEPILSVIWHLCITGIQSSSFAFFTKRESVLKLSVMLFLGCSFFPHAVSIIPQQDKYYESDSIIEELLTLNVPLLSLLPAAFELFFLIKCCKKLNLQELFLSFVMAEILKFVQMQRFSLLLSIIWLLLVLVYSKKGNDDFEFNEDKEQNFTKKTLAIIFAALLLCSSIFFYMLLPEEDKQHKFRYHFVNSAEDHFRNLKQW